MPVSSYSCDLICSHFSELMRLMEQIMRKKFDERLARFLLEESRLAGTAREFVTRMLRYFQSESMAKQTRGSVEITDAKKLAALING